MGDNVICLFEFVEVDLDIRISYEKHYRLVDSSQLSSDEMKSYYSHQ
jgi:protein associated with RNAse G/E